MMKQLPFIPFLLLLACSVKSDADEGRLKELASRVTIIRDSWGIPHIYGKTDADVVFGLMYAQCEDNFEKVERAYIEKMGRLSEVEGEGRFLEDMRTRLIFDTSATIADFNKSPAWLKALLQAFADGINYYLSVHPNVQ